MKWERAACRDADDPGAFFGDETDQRTARNRYCRRCDLTAQCEEARARHAIRWGVWGGRTEHDRETDRRDARRDTRAVHP